MFSYKIWKCYIYILLKLSDTTFKRPRKYHSCRAAWQAHDVRMRRISHWNEDDEEKLARLMLNVVKWQVNIPNLIKSRRKSGRFGPYDMTFSVINSIPTARSITPPDLFRSWCTGASRSTHINFYKSVWFLFFIRRSATNCWTYEKNNENRNKWQQIPVRVRIKNGILKNLPMQIQADSIQTFYGGGGEREYIAYM